MMSRLINLEPQPDFPVGDLTPNNSLILSYLLEQEPGIGMQRTPVNSNYNLLRAIHGALERTGQTTEETPATLRALMDGFNSFQTITTLVRPPEIFDIHTAATQANRLLLPGGGISEIRLAESRALFLESSPRAFGVIAGLGSRSMALVNARVMGATTARQLQLPVAA